MDNKSLFPILLVAGTFMLFYTRSRAEAAVPPGVQYVKSSGPAAAGEYLQSILKAHARLPSGPASLGKKSSGSGFSPNG